MKFFGQIKRFTSLIFRDVEDAKDITLQFDPNTVYTANRVISLPSGDQNMVLMRYPIAGVTANTVPYFSDTTGNLLASETTATELSYVHGVTSSIQTQLNNAGGGSFPSYTTAERDALTPAAGMVIYNTTTNRFQGYCAGAVAAWVNLHGWGA